MEYSFINNLADLLGVKNIKESTYDYLFLTDDFQLRISGDLNGVLIKPDSPTDGMMLKITATIPLETFSNEIKFNKSINISSTKKTELIARQIKQRIVPDAVSYMSEFKKLKEKNDAFTRQIENIRELFTDAERNLGLNIQIPESLDSSVSISDNNILLEVTPERYLKVFKVKVRVDKKLFSPVSQLIKLHSLGDFNLKSVSDTDMQIDTKKSRPPFIHALVSLFPLCEDKDHNKKIV